ncbi:MAG: putative metal-binding motif-containing protein [Sandaracinaceae bacterium]
MALPALLALTWVACGDGVSPDGGVDEPDGRVTMDGETPPPADTGPQCESDRGCDDGDYCNGTERCLPGSAEAGPNGCAPGAPPCDEATEICDEAADRCTLDECNDGGDADGDGDARIACGGNDCDDTNGMVYSTAQEVCDAMGVDEDCEPATIRSETPGLEDGDADDDGFVDDACFNTRPDGTENRGRDCDDGAADVNPGITLDGCNGVDDDCDGMIDEDPDFIFYQDIDGDGFGVVSTTVTACSAPPGFTLMSGDCDDTRASVNPGNAEICNGIDDDCSGLADDPAPPDTCDCTNGSPQTCGTTDVGACSTMTVTCSGGMWPTCTFQDPQLERCGGGDRDCDGLTDDADPDIASGSPSVTGAIVYYRDADADGYGDPGASENRCSPRAGYVLQAGDCDDTVATTHDRAAELCDGTVDDDCDGTVDEGCDCTNGTTRRCGMTDVGRCQYGTETCMAGRWQACSGHVDPAPYETCGAEDEDCDGLTNDADPGIASGDISLTGATVYYRDADGDMYGDGTMPSRRCTAAAGWVLVTGDCDDTRMGSNPGAMESCAAGMRDEDCDMVVDEGCGCTNGETQTCGTTNVGDCSSMTVTCAAGAWPTCRFQDPEPEICGGGDEDCDGLSNDNDPSIAMGDPGVTGATLYYRDMDGDGEGDPMNTIRRCSAMAGWVLVGGDCDDSNPSRGSMLTEAPFACDGIDNDCDSRVDEDPNPEVCGGGDEDCDGLSNDDDPDIAAGDRMMTGATLYYRDMDGDGYGISAVSRNRCGPATGWSTLIEDCDDSRTSRSPGNMEGAFMCDGIDNDCDGTVDEDGTTTITCYRDIDGDGYGQMGSTMRACSCPAGWTSRSDSFDCIDSFGARSALIHPGAGYQTLGYCGDGQTPCTNAGGFSGCRNSFGICNSGTLWDYDCSGTATPQSRAGCASSGMGCYTSPSGTYATHTAADCGTDVDRGRCSIGCSLFASGTMTLGCR